MKKQFVLLFAFIVIIVIAVVTLSGSSDTSTPAEDSAVPEGDPIDVALGFYNDWLDAVQSTTTDPYAAGLATDQRLSEVAQAYIAVTDKDADIDPVICQMETPERVGAKVSYVLEREAQYMMLARGLAEKSSRQAVVDLVAQDGQWVINEISCVEGESMPDREFTFEREGFLLKSVPPPLDPEYWHLVFEERGVQGHTAPLFFSEDSMCIDAAGVETVCNPDTLPEAGAALVKGQMTEAGVEVSRIELQDSN